MATEGKHMNKLFNRTSNSSKDSRAQKTSEMHWASDDVERVARRTPALFRTNVVPKIERKPLTDMQAGA